MNLNTNQVKLWMILGDFKFIRGPENRNIIGGDHNNMMLDIIINLDLVEIPLKGRSFIWSDMQDQPLLETFDWVFTSSQGTSEHPFTVATPLAKISSDHVPIKIQIDSNIPKSQIFRFEEFWTKFAKFIETVENHWNNSIFFADSAKNISAKFKAVRRGLKRWSKQFSQLNKTIENCCYYVKLINGIEDHGLLTDIERRFRKILIIYTKKLLESIRKYWRIRANIRWAKLGDENTKSFQCLLLTYLGITIFLS